MPKNKIIKLLIEDCIGRGVVDNLKAIIIMKNNERAEASKTKPSPLPKIAY